MTEATNSGNNANYYHGGYLIGNPYYRTVAGEFELSDSPYGTFDQGGNIFEWNETAVTSWSRGQRGGSIYDIALVMSDLSASSRGFIEPTYELFDVGFRVASNIPEPSTLLLLYFGSLAVLWRRRGLVCASILTAALCAATSAHAVTIDMVAVGNPGNAPDPLIPLLLIGAGVRVFALRRRRNAPRTTLTTHDSMAAPRFLASPWRLL